MYYIECYCHLHSIVYCLSYLSTIMHRPQLTPDYNIIWEFFKKFLVSVYSRTPALFLQDLLKLQLPEMCNASENTLTEYELEKQLRNIIKDDDRIPRRLFSSPETFLVGLKYSILIRNTSHLHGLYRIECMSEVTTYCPWLGLVDHFIATYHSTV